MGTVDAREAPGPLSNRLAELADRAGASWRRSVEEWMQAAVLLAEARELAAYGEWGRFLETAGIPERTARRMVRLAEAGFKPATVAALGIRGADEQLARIKALKSRLRVEMDLEALERGADGAETVEQIEGALAECERIGSQLDARSS